MIRVLIVDDSAFMRNALANILAEDPEISVAGTARDGVEAVELAERLRPDVMTLDVEMPRMDGIEALRRIMDRTPVPVLMVSSLTTEGAQETLTALDLGAVDFIPKNLSELSVDIAKIKEFLIERVKGIAKSGARGAAPRPRPPVRRCGPVPDVLLREAGRPASSRSAPPREGPGRSRRSSPASRRPSRCLSWSPSTCRRISRPPLPTG